MHLNAVWMTQSKSNQTFSIRRVFDRSEFLHFSTPVPCKLIISSSWKNSTSHVHWAQTTDYRCTPPKYVFLNGSWRVWRYLGPCWSHEEPAVRPRWGSRSHLHDMQSCTLNNEVPCVTSHLRSYSFLLPQLASSGGFFFSWRTFTAGAWLNQFMPVNILLPVIHLKKVLYHENTFYRALFFFF